MFRRSRGSGPTLSVARACDRGALTARLMRAPIPRRPKLASATTQARSRVSWSSARPYVLALVPFAVVIVLGVLHG